MAAPLPPPLSDLRVLEFAGLAPGPFAGLLLADHGASVLRIDQPIASPTLSNTTFLPSFDLLTRRKSSIAVDLKSHGGHSLITQLIPHIDILIDPFRPKVLERLGLGPDILLALNPRLIFARLTGFRRDGHYKAMAGHDINYLAVSGALSLLGPKGANPSPPLNLLGDFAGGGAMLVQGILLALLARERTGRGQVVEANMVDGSAYLVTATRLGRKTLLWDHPRGENLLDGGCPWYGTYETADGKYVAVGCLEPRFFAVMLEGLGLQGRGLERSRYDRKTWPALRTLLESVFKARSRWEWEEIFDGKDACVTPVLELDELEGGNFREGDQRPPVTLRETPSLAISRRSDNDISSGSSGNPIRDVREGQGEGILGDGWTGFPLSPNYDDDDDSRGTGGDGEGEGRVGERLLKEWLAWEPDSGFYVKREKGGLIVLPRQKLTKL